MITHSKTIQSLSHVEPPIADINSGLETLIEATMARSAGVEFHPEKHIDFKPPSKTYTMSDIKLKTSPISDFAVSESFQLFSLEAVQRMREEIFKPEVMNNFQYSSNLAQCQLRGYAAKYVLASI